MVLNDDTFMKGKQVRWNVIGKQTMDPIWDELGEATQEIQAADPLQPIEPAHPAQPAQPPPPIPPTPFISPLRRRRRAAKRPWARVTARPGRRRCSLPHRGQNGQGGGVASETVAPIKG